MHVVVNGWFWNQMTVGSGQYLHYLVRHLPRVAPADTFTLVLSRVTTPVRSGDGDIGGSTAPGWRLEVAATPFDRINDDLAKVWFEQVTFPAICRRLQADLAFVPFWGSPWRRPCAVAVTVHDLIPLLLPQYRGGLLQRLYTSLVSATARRADVVLTDSQASRLDIVRHLRIGDDRVHAVLLAADDRYRAVTDGAELDRVRRRYALPRRFILYLGGFDVRKNVPALVRAYARWLRGETTADPPGLVIAGRLPAAHTPFYPDPRAVAAEAGVADHTRFIGWIEEADKPALYSLADLFAFPSLYEGFGLPAAEAAACGTAVITSNRSSLPEVVPEAVLVDPQDVDAIAAGLAQGLAQAGSPPPAVHRTWEDVIRETYGVMVAGTQPDRQPA